MSEFFTITLVIILAAISPGPDFAIVTKNSLMYTRKAGIFTAIGVSLSLFIHASYCILGLAIIISQSLLAFSIIKYLGAGYLIYIGIKSLLVKKETLQLAVHESQRMLNNFQAFRQGLLCNLLNPKAIMFLLAFFTLVVKPGSSILTEIAYGFEIAAIHLIWFSTLAFILTNQHVKNSLGQVQYYMVKAMGAVLVGFGARVATLHQTIM